MATTSKKDIPPDSGVPAAAVQKPHRLIEHTSKVNRRTLKQRQREAILRTVLVYNNCEVLVKERENKAYDISLVSIRVVHI